MNDRRILFLLLVALALNTGLAGAAEFYWFGEYWSVDGTNEVGGLSDNGQVAVGWTVSPSGIVPYRWTRESGLVAIDDQMWVAEDVSDDGSVIVGRIGFHDRTAIRWTEQSGLQIIGPGTMDAVTPDGRIIAGSIIPPGATETQAVRWLPDGTFHTLGLPTTFSSRALGISNDGSVVAGFIETPEKDLFRWTETTGATGLSYYALNCVGGPFLSPNGSVVVGAAQVGFEGGFAVEMFRWTAETGLVALQGTTSIDPRGVSDDGATVVGQGSGEEGGDAALIWDPVHGVRDLEDVLTHDYGLGANFGDYDSGDGLGRLLEARFVSADGRTIAGIGRTWRQGNGLSHRESWVAVLDVPVSMVMPGDIDLNGTIDRGDVAKFTTSLGTTAAGTSTWQSGDFNRDGTTTLTDLMLLNGNLGWSMHSPNGSPAGAVPEPTTASLAALTLVVLILNHKVRRGSQRNSI